MINTLPPTYNPAKPKQSQSGKPAPANQAASRPESAPRFGQFKPRRDAQYYKNLGLDILDEADELKDEGKSYLKDADRYAREAKKEDQLADNRLSLSKYYEKKAQRSFSQRSWQKNMQESLRKKESAFFHMDTADYDADKAQKYKNIGLNRLDEADELYSEGEELLDVAKDLKRKEEQRYTPGRRHSAPTGSRPFVFTQPQPDRSHTTDSYFQHYTDTKFYYPKPAPPKPQPQWTKPSKQGYSSTPSGTHGMHRSKSNPIPPSFTSPYDRPQSSHFPKSHHAPRTSFFNSPIFEEPIFEEPVFEEEPIIEERTPQAPWEYIPADEDILRGSSGRGGPSRPTASPYNMSGGASHGKQKEPSKKSDPKPFEMPHRPKPGHGFQSTYQTSGQPSGHTSGGSAHKKEPSPGVKRSSTFTEGSTRPKFQPNEPSGHSFQMPKRSNTAPANPNANDKKGKAKEEVRPYTAEEMKRDEEILREKTRAENRTFQANQYEADRLKEENFSNISWRLQRRNEVKKFFDTINLPENQRNFENRKAFNTAYKKYMITHQRYINDANSSHAAELERFKEMSIFKEDLETYMGWIGKPLAELSTWEGQDEKTRKPASELTGSERFQAYTAAEATILRQREEIANPKPPSKPEKHEKKHGMFRRRTWF